MYLPKLSQVTFNATVLDKFKHMEVLLTSITWGLAVAQYTVFGGPQGGRALASQRMITPCPVISPMGNVSALGVKKNIAKFYNHNNYSEDGYPPYAAVMNETATTKMMNVEQCRAMFNKVFPHKSYERNELDLAMWESWPEMRGMPGDEIFTRICLRTGML